MANPCAPTLMTSEWTKALLSAAFGFMVAVAAEPIKTSLLHWFKRQRINQAIYSELGRTYHLLDYARGIGMGQRQDLSQQEWVTRARAEELLLSISSEAYDHYLEKEREAVLELESYAAFKSLYRVIRRLIEAAAWQQKEPIIDEIFRWFEAHFVEGTLDSKLLLKWRKKHRDRTYRRIDTILSSKRLPGTLIRDSQP